MKNKLRVILDTNIFINGIFFPNDHKNCAKIIELIDSKQFYLLFSQETIGELVYVMKNFIRHYLRECDNKFDLLQWLMELFYYSYSINTEHTNNLHINDESDEMFLRCAIEGNANYLVSNDYKSGLHDCSNRKLKIVNSQEFCNIFDDIKEAAV